MTDAIITKYEKETEAILNDAEYFTSKNFGENKWGRNYEDWDEDPEN